MQPISVQSVRAHYMCDVDSIFFSLSMTQCCFTHALDTVALNATEKDYTLWNTSVDKGKVNGTVRHSLSRTHSHTHARSHAYLLLLYNSL